MSAVAAPAPAPALVDVDFDVGAGVDIAGVCAVVLSVFGSFVASVDAWASSCIISSEPPPRGDDGRGGLLLIPTAAGEVSPYLNAFDGCGTRAG